MTCVNPLQVWRSKDGNRPNGRLRLVFHEANGIPNTEMYIPCGQCIACRLERSRQWAMRCVHEAKQWEKNCFITLTYNEAFVPKDKSLNKADFTKFMKRLRKKYGSEIRFYQCGEYGENNDRPHYHACIFNHDFEDKKLWTIRNDVKLYRSEELEKLWPFGHSTIGEVTFESAAYVARYVMKKITGENAKDHYNGRLPEYTNMSRRPGIGKTFYDEFKDDIYNYDNVILRNGLKMRPPKYYDKLYENEQPERMVKLKAKRQLKHNPFEMQGYRLRCKSRLLKIKLKKLKRGYENV